mgnify:CR=1 FL=1
MNNILEFKRQNDQADQWIGSSNAISELDKSLNIYAKTNFPIAIRGAKNSGKAIAAKRIHNCAWEQQVLFHEADCCDIGMRFSDADWMDFFSGKINSSVYLRNFHLLSQSGFSGFEKAWKCQQQVRLLVSFPDSVEIAGALAHWLEVNVLSLELPGLKDRRDDMRALINLWFRRWEGNPLILSADAWLFLEGCENLSEFSQLERVIQKVIFLSENKQVEIFHMKKWFPTLASDFIRVTLPDFTASQDEHIIPIKLFTIESILGIHFDANNEHPGLVRALQYLVEHYAKSISMTELAEKACVSPSHLSFLLKQRLGKSFKQVITSIRIERAKSIFQRMPARQITQVCSDVGFADLSNFEKLFKRFVGLSPSIYRQQFRKPLSTN